MKTKQKLLAVAISLLLAAGCAAQPEATKGEAVKSKTTESETTKSERIKPIAGDDEAAKKINKDKNNNNKTEKEVLSKPKKDESKKDELQKDKPKKLTPAVKIANQLNAAVLLAKDSDNTADRLVSGIGIARLLQAIAAGAADASYRQIDDYLGVDKLTLADMQFARDKALQYADAMLIVDKKAIDKAYEKRLASAGFVLENNLQSLNLSVAKKTDGLIKKALDKLDPNSKMVLLNSLHFKDKWAKPFAKKQTQPQVFKSVCDGKIIDKTVPVMSKEDDIALYRDDTAKMLGLALPFAGDYTLLLSMDSEAASPQSADKAAAWLLTADSDNIENIMTADKMAVRLTLPKMQLSSKSDLIPALRANGINDIFDADKANLKKISSKESLYVQKFMQQVVFNADEEGAEAAAVTTAVISLRSARITESVNINKPFAFAVVQNDSGLLILSGKINQLNSCKESEEKNEKANK